MRYADALSWLYDRQRFGVKLGLDAITDLLKRLDDPQDAFRAFHVGGTNGKGSVAAFIESAVRTAGHRVGLYTSPHLVSFRERIVVGGQPISPEDVAVGVERLRPVVAEMDARRSAPTYFEIATALAFDHFRAKKVPFVVVEVGMGGRLDATNLCHPLSTVVTNVGLDHTDRLGTSVQAIAAEKAGILRPGVPAFTGARREALDVIVRQATKVKAPLKVVRAPPESTSTLDGNSFGFPFAGATQEFRTSMLGAHQVENACLALAALGATQAAVPVPLEAAQKGVASARWPGRLEIVDRDPLLVLDGAHNVPAFEALGEFLDRHFPERKVAVCIAVLRDKAASRMMQILAPRVSRVILTEAPTPRTLSAKELEYAMQQDGPPTTQIPNPNEALRALLQGGDEPLRLVTGSLFLVGEARAQVLRLERDPDVKQALLQ